MCHDDLCKFIHASVIESIAASGIEHDECYAIASKIITDIRDKFGGSRHYISVNKINKQSEILSMIADGFTKQQVSDHLNISIRTINRVIEKSLNRRSRQRCGLGDPDWNL